MRLVNNYLKNVTKSVAYAAADVSKEVLMPNVGEFVEANSDFMKSTYAALKNPKITVRKSVDAMQQNKIYKALDYGAKNAIEDLRTGKFYNKEREDRDMLKNAGMDVDSWNDLSEFGVEDDWEQQLDNKKSSSIKSEVTNGDLQIVGAIESSNAVAANATINAIITANQYAVKNSRVNNSLIYQQNERLFGGLHKDISVLNATMDSLFKMTSATMQNLDKNTSGFFTESLRLSTERNAMLKELLEMERNKYKTAIEREKEASKMKTRKSWSSISSSGMIDIQGYLDFVKGNIKEQISSMTGGIGGGFGEDSNMLAAFMTSPFKEGIKSIVKGVVPNAIKVATQQIDETISGVFGTVIGRLGNARNSDDAPAIVQQLAKIFGINTKIDKRIDGSKYEKGAVPFDGITRKAITEIIPEHLMRIESALTGQRSEMYDYHNGRWVKGKDIKIRLDNIEKYAINSGTSDIRYKMKKAAEFRKKHSEYSAEDIDKALDEFFRYYYYNNGDFNPKASIEKNNIDIYDPAYDKLRELYDLITKIYQDVDIPTRMVAAKNILSSKEYHQRAYDQINADPTDIINRYENLPSYIKNSESRKNGSKLGHNFLLDTKDNLNNTIFDYLQLTVRELQWQRENFGLRAVIVGSKKGGKKAKFTDFNNVKISAKNIGNDSANTKSSNSSRESKPYSNPKAMGSAVRKIVTGAAMDLSWFESDEIKALLCLSSLLKNEDYNTFADYVDTEDAVNPVRLFLDKHIINKKVKNESDVSRLVEEAQRKGTTTDKVSITSRKTENGDGDTPFDKLVNFAKNGKAKIQGYYEDSTKGFADFLQKANVAIYDMFFKEKVKNETGEDYDNLFDLISSKFKDVFNNIATRINELLIDPIKEKLGLNDKFKDMKDKLKTSLKDQIKSMGNFFINSNKEVYGGLINKARTKIQGTKLAGAFSNATGQQEAVTQEPEFSDDPNTQALLHLLGANARGTMGRPFSGNTMLSKGELLFNSRGVSQVNKTGAYHLSKPTHILNSVDSAKLLGKPVTTSLAGDESRENAVLRKMYPKHAGGTVQINGKEVDIKPYISEAKTYAPEMITGGAIGGIATTLFGLAGGPLLGGAIGSAIGLISKSKLVQNALFGEAGEDGKRSGGLVPKKIIDVVQKYAPDALKFGMAGIIPGLLTPLGPVGGLLVGSAIGILKNNETFKEKLFGTTDENGKHIDGILDTFAKSFEPIKDTFSDLKDKINDTIQENFVDPIKRFIKPTVHLFPKLLKSFGERLMDKIKDSFADPIKKIIQDKILDPISKGVGKILKPIVMAPLKILSLPFRGLGKIGDKLTGWGIRNNKMTNMTAKERVAWMMRNGQEPTQRDLALAHIGDNQEMLEGAKTASADIDNILAMRDGTIAARRDAKNKINDFLVSKEVNGKRMSKNARKAVRKALKAGDMQGAIKALTVKYAVEGSSEGFTKSEAEQLIKEISPEFKKYIDKDKQLDSIDSMSNVEKDAAIEEKRQQLVKLGLLDKNEKLDSRKLKDLKAQIDTEVDFYDKNKTEIKTLETLDKNGEYLKGLFTTVSGLARYVMSGRDPEVAKQLDADISNAQKEINKTFENRTTKATEKIGDLSGIEDKTTTGRSVFKGGTIHEGMDNKNVKNISKGNFSKGDLSKFKQITLESIKSIHKLKFELDESAKIELNKYGAGKQNNIVKFIKRYRTDIGSMVGTRPLNDRDISFINGTKLNWKNCINAWGILLSKGYSPSNFESLRDVYNATMDNDVLLNAASGIGPETSNATEEQTQETDTTEVTEASAEEPPAQHFLGTIASLAFRGAKAVFNGARAIGNGIKGLAGDGSNGVFSPIRTTTPGIGGNIAAPDSPSVSGNLDEVDKPGDGKDKVVTSDGIMTVKTDSDGSASYDTSDSETKRILNLRTTKEQLMAKLHSAQLKASEKINAAFGDIDKQKAKKGFGLLGALIFGGLLWKSGILTKIWDNAIKPLWVNKIKPFLTDKVWPWVKTTVVPAFGELLSSAIAGLGSLASDIIAGIPGALSTWWGSRNGGENDGGTVSTADLDKYDDNELTGMYDENKKQLTVQAAKERISNGDAVYNKDGVEATVEDGTATFKTDKSYTPLTNRFGARFGKQVGKSFLTGKSFTTTIGRSGSLLNTASKAINAPFEAAANANKFIGGFARAGEVAEDFIGPAPAKVSFLKKFQSGVAAVNKDAGDKIIKSYDDTVSTVTKLKGSKLGELAAKLKENLVKGIETLFGNEKVSAKLAKGAAEVADDVPGFIAKFKGVVSEAFETSIKNINKVTKALTSNVAKKIFFWAFLITDFLTGCDKAEKILGITDPTAFETVVAGLINALGGLIIIPQLLPSEFPGSVSWIATTLLKLGGDSLEERQAEAERQYELFGAEEGYETKEDWLNGEYSITGKIGHGIRTGFNNVIGKLFGEKDEETGKRTGGMFSNLKDNFVSSLTDSLNLVKYAFTGDYESFMAVGTDDDSPLNKINTVVTKAALLPVVGVTSFVKNAVTKLVEFGTNFKNNLITRWTDSLNLVKYAFTGDHESFMSVGSDDDSPLNKINTVVTKAALLPVVGVTSFVKNAVTKLTEFGSKVKDEIIDIGTTEVELAKYAFTGDFDSFATTTVSDDDSVVKQLIVRSSKIMMAPIAGISALIKKLINPISKVISTLTTAGTVIGTNLLEEFKFAIAGDVKNLINYDAINAKGDIATGLPKIISNIAKPLLMPITLVSKGINVLGTAIKNTITGAIDVGQNVSPIFGYAIRGDISNLWNYTVNNDSVVGKISNAVGYGFKVTSMPIALVSKGAQLLVDTIKNTINGAIDVGQNVSPILGYAARGELSNLWNYTVNNDSVVGKISNAVGYGLKIASMPMALTSRGAQLLTTGVKNTVNAAIDIGENVSPILQYAINGELASLWDYTVGDDTVTGRVSNAVGYGLKIVTMPIALVSKGINVLGTAIKNVANAAVDIGGEFTSLLTTATEGDFSSFLAYESQIDPSSLTGKVSSAVVGVGKVLLTPISLVSTFFTKVSDWVTNIASWIQSKFSNIVQFFKDPIEYIYNGLKTAIPTNSETGKNVAEKLLNLFSSLAGFVTGDSSGSGTYGRGYAKQTDPSISSIRYNSSRDSEYQTIGNSGCGPAAAVNAVRSAYGMGPGSEVVSAANYAVRRGYKETNGGTMPGFFGDYFARNGLSSQTSFNKAQIMKNINSGRPTVLMGKDTNGVSNRTPFGRTSHYVTVTGIDKRGRAIVQDPESKYDNQLYNVRDLMSKTTLGISTGRGSFGRGIFGRGKWGRGKSKIIFVGDSRGVMMQNYIGDAEASKHIWSVKGSMGLSWMKSEGVPNIEGKISGDTAVVIMMGVNDVLGMRSNSNYYSGYLDYINEKAPGWVSKGAEVYYVSINPVKPGGYSTPWGTIDDDIINSWNSGMQSGLCSDVHYLDTKSKMSFNTIDGLHYDKDTSVNLYNLIVESVANGTASSSSSTTTQNGTVDIQQTSQDNSIVGLFKRYLESSKIGKAMTKAFGGFGRGVGEYAKQTDPAISSIRYNSSSDSEYQTIGNSGCGPAAAVNAVRSAYGMGDSNTVTYRKPSPVPRYIPKKYTRSTKLHTSKYGRGQDPDTVAQTMWDCLRGKGFSEESTAGVIGNAVGETNLNPANDISVNCGVFCFEKSTGNGGGLLNYASSKGKNWTDVEVQIDYLLDPSNAANLSNAFRDYTGKSKHVYSTGEWCWWPEKMTLEEFKALTDIDLATEIFERVYERASGNAAYYPDCAGIQRIRIPAAKKYFEMFTGRPAPDGSSSTTTGTTDAATEKATSVIGLYEQYLQTTKIGKALDLFLGSTSSSSSSSTTTDSTTPSSSSASGDAAAFIQAAANEVGYHETGNNMTKYGEWYPMNGQPWCAMFVSWAADQAGIGQDIIPKYSYCPTGYQWFKDKGQTVSNSDAKPGDIAFFNNGVFYHTGIVEAADSDGIHTIEGNSSDAVTRRTYSPGDGKVYLARPKFANTSGTTTYKSDTKYADMTDAPDTANTLGGNDNKPLSRYGTFTDSLSGYGKLSNSTTTPTSHTRNSFLALQRKSMVNTGRRVNHKDLNGTFVKVEDTSGTGSFGRGSNDGAICIDYSGLLNTILKILITIADNTDKLNTVVTILNSSLGSDIKSSDVSKVNSESLKSKLKKALLNNNDTSLSTYADTMSSKSMFSIINAMNAIAAE